ncbi:MAG: formate dehydrogenase subunit gamma [Wenzhouxiangellaceae bacterium]|nr:formate dehydrogenase subunit gamma [Wenzhouxiangellaceae bacterium]
MYTANCNSRRSTGGPTAWLLVLATLLLVSFGLSGSVLAQAADDEAAWQETNPRSEFWRDARRSEVGKTTVLGKESGVLIQSGGENFRQIRNGPISTYGPWVLAFMFLGVAGMFALTGGQKVEKPLSGKRVPRWGAYDRFVHWVMGILFIVLAITGLSLLFGRAVLIPLMGAEAFASWALVAKNIHNFSGPVFAASLILLVLSMARHNIPSKVDIDWFLKGGFAGKHVPTGTLNAGEKLWFWFNGTAGIAVAVTGVLMIIPGFFESRGPMQWSLLLHAGLAIVWIGGSFVHMYMGTIGAKGALDAMTKGHVSSEWAEQHHDLWYAEVKDKEFVDESLAESPRVRGGSESPA